MTVFVESVTMAEPLDRPDEDVFADVRDRLWRDDTTRALEHGALAVEVHGGQVFLTGHVTKHQYRRHVGELLRGVRGVRAIHDGLVADPDLVTEVAQALAADPRTRRHVLGVGAFQGWIHLAGEVPDLATRQAAEIVAARVPGVRGVLALPHLPREHADGGENRRPLQPQTGQSATAADGPAGRVEQVVICPDNQLVSHIVVGGTLEVNWRLVRGRWVVPIQAVSSANDGGVFLSDSLRALAARPAYEAADFRLPPPTWQPPFPYHTGDVRWLVQEDPTPRDLPYPAGVPVTVAAVAMA